MTHRHATPAVLSLAFLATFWSPSLGADDPAPAGDAALFERLDADRNNRVSADEVPAEHKSLFERLLRRADADGDKSLSRAEFAASLVPRRPEKPIEKKQPSTLPQADAVRWLLLSMDTSGNTAIEEKEVPERLRRVFAALADRVDGNKDRVLDRRELLQGGRPLAQIAGRYVQSAGIDVAAELTRLDRRMGAAARRFDDPPARSDVPGDPNQARRLFARADRNGDGQIEPAEFPQQRQRMFQRLMRIADRDGDNRLSEREFVAGSRLLQQRPSRAEPRSGRAGRPPSAEAMPADDTQAPTAMPAEASMPADEP